MELKVLGEYGGNSLHGKILKKRELQRKGSLDICGGHPSCMYVYSGELIGTFMWGK